VVAFNGDLTEIVGVAEPGPVPKLSVAIRPPTTHVGEQTRFRVTVSANGFRIEGALVRLAGEQATTDARGKAKLTRTFERAGRRRARASKGGYIGARRTIRVRRR